MLDKMKLHGFRFFSLVAFMTGVFCTLLLFSCGLLPGSSSPSELTEEFYREQISGLREPLKEDMFTDEATARAVNELLVQRTASYGPCVSSKKVGSNRKITIEVSGRRESNTYIFEVECLNGQTRETLTIGRNRRTEPFRITAYSIEEIPRPEEPLPAGTCST